MGSHQIDFENGYSLEVMTSSALIGKAPAGFNWAAYYKTFGVQRMTPRELAVNVWRGYAFTPVWYEARREENFISAGHIAFDFDAGDESSSLAFLFRDGSFAWMFASFGYSTPSSTPDAPRSRVVFVLKDPILNAAEYRTAYQAVAWFIARDGSPTDPACKDPLRLYYGSKGCEVKANWSILPAAALAYAITEYRAAHPPAPPPASSSSFVPVAPDERRANGKLAQLGQKVHSAPQGDRHNTLLRMARLGGGYIASGALDETAVVAELSAAARGWGDDEAEIERVIRDGITNGKTAPVQFTGPQSLMQVFR